MEGKVVQVQEIQPRYRPSDCVVVVVVVVVVGGGGGGGGGGVNCC